MVILGYLALAITGWLQFRINPGWVAMVILRFLALAITGWLFRICPG